jgi:DNA polymerase-3 subunit delta
MPTISYKELEKYLTERGDAPFAPVYLIFGEEMLVKGAFDTLLEALVPASKRNTNYDALDGAHENIHAVIARVNTYSLLPGTKVIALRDSRIFYAEQDKSRLLENAQKACRDDDLKKAAGHLLRLMGLLNLTWEDLDRSSRKKSLGQSDTPAEDDDWLDALIAYCRENNLSVPAGADDGHILQLAVEKGFPKNNHLIITTDLADKRRALYKTLSSKGVVIDCSVPRGERRADRIAQESVLVDTMNATLAEGGKKMNRAAYLALYEMTGFDLRTFSGNLEKLISFVGERPEITIADVESALQRTKIDPIYELTNALTDRQTEAVLVFLESVQSSGVHPLQIFSAMINQVRKLLLAKDFVESPYGRQWQASCPYDYFQKHVMPAIVEYDRQLLDHLDGRQAVPDKNGAAPASGSGGKKTKKKNAKAGTDLLIAKNPNNPYPIYLLLKKSERFSKEELINAFETLHTADKQLKSGSQNYKLVLEKVILSICRREAAEVQSVRRVDLVDLVD